MSFTRLLKTNATKKRAVLTGVLERGDKKVFIESVIYKRKPVTTAWMWNLLDKVGGSGQTY